MPIVLRLTATVRSAFSTALSLVGMYGASACRCDRRGGDYRHGGDRRREHRGTDDGLLGLATPALLKRMTS
jgi:hypothetical protein